MTTNDKIRDGKQQYDINRETAKIGTLLSRKMINMNTLQVNILLCNQRRVIEQAQFTYSSLGKSLQKQMIKDQGKTCNSNRRSQKKTG